MAAIFLARVGTVHGATDTVGKKGQIEIAKWSRPDSGGDRGALKQIVEIAIIAVAQPTYAGGFLVRSRVS